MSFRIALFGSPGCGKSAITSKLLEKKSEEIQWLEFSRDFLVNELNDTDGNYAKIRAEGRRIFSRISANEGATWAADRVLTKQLQGKNTILTGVRGISNLHKLRANGFFCIFIDCSDNRLAKRVGLRNSITYDTALAELKKEDDFFNNDEIRSTCDYVLDNDSDNLDFAEYQLYNLCMTASRDLVPFEIGKTCIKCTNSRKNGALFPNNSDICSTCKSYNLASNDDSLLKEQKDFFFSELKSAKHKGTKFLVGISGGKDSTLALHQVRNETENVEAFTIDTGYYPLTVLSRSIQVAKELETPHTIFNARELISPEIQASYEKSAEIYSEEPGINGPTLELYQHARDHYSVNEKIVLPYVRACQLCRRVVIPSYYHLAKLHGAKFIVLGINEWVNLSSSSTREGYKLSGIRKLQPDRNEAPVYVVHLPFLLGSDFKTNRDLLEKMGWQQPFNESFVETNGNSCLFAKASEYNAFSALGFHPDSTRLSREVTAGFLTKEEASRALSMVHRTIWSVSEVLQYAKIL